MVSRSFMLGMKVSRLYSTIIGQWSVYTPIRMLIRKFTFSFYNCSFDPFLKNKSNTKFNIIILFKASTKRAKSVQREWKTLGECKNSLAQRDEQEEKMKSQFTIILCRTISCQWTGHCVTGQHDTVRYQMRTKVYYETSDQDSRKL